MLFCIVHYIVTLGRKYFEILILMLQPQKNIYTFCNLSSECNACVHELVKFDYPSLSHVKTDVFPLKPDTVTLHECYLPVNCTKGWRPLMYMHDNKTAENSLSVLVIIY